MAVRTCLKGCSCLFWERGARPNATMRALLSTLLLALPLTSATILSGFDHLANPAPHAEEGAVAVSVNCTFVEANSEDHFSEAHAYPYGVGVCKEEGKASFQVNFADVGQTSYFEPGETIDIDIVRRR